MKRFSWAVVLACLAVAGVALAQTDKSDRRADEPPHVAKAVTLNFIIVEVNKAAGRKPSIDLSDPEKIPEQVRALEEKGEASVISRVKLSSLEQMPCSVEIGETRPVVMGRAAAGFAATRGPRTEAERPNFSYQMTNVGMIVSATSRVEADDAIVAEVQVQSSRLSAVAKPQTDDPAAAQRTTTLQSRSTVRIPKGRGVILGAAQSAGDDESRETLILVSGHVEPLAAAAIEPEKAAAAPAEELRVFALRHASAAEAARTLQIVFAGRNLRLAPEARTNHLIVRGGPEQLREVEALLLRMDSDK